MKKIFGLIALLCVGFVNAQPLEKSLLWKISGNGLKQPSYLFGTIHITCDATIDVKVKKAMDDTKQLYLELDMDDPGMQSAMMAQMMMPGGENVKNLCTPEEYALVDKFLQEKIGMGLAMMGTLKPMVISMMLYPMMLECPMQSVEQELIKLSAGQKEETLGLETVDEQMKALDAVPLREQMAELVKTAKSDLVADKKEIQQILAIYKTADIERMLQFTRESENVMSSKYEADLLGKRNVNWIPKIASVAKETPTLFAVGAAHLAGDQGVIKLLRKAGFVVEAVK